MKILSISLTFLLLPVISHAGASSDPLATLIAKTVDDGQVYIENESMRKKLGLKGSNLVVKTIEVGEKASGDGRNHYVSVYVHPARDGRPIPDAIKFGSGSVKKADGQLYIDGFIFLADMSGNLQKAFHNSGLAHHLKSEELPIDKRKTKKLFEKEKEFFLAREK